MKKAILFDFEADKINNEIRIQRSFDAPLELVWSAWTEPDLLDLWWAPKPYVNKTKKLEFTQGGRWHYSMTSPEGIAHWCLFDYENIVPNHSFSGMDSFCDENEAVIPVKARTRWENTFIDQGEETRVHIVLKFDRLEDLEEIIAMGFKEGFTMGLQNLDDYIAAQFYLRKKNKPSNQERVSTYVNFPGNTEEAFHFYKSVFNTEFVNGIQRFGDIPADPSQPAMSEELKKMVLHIELPLLGNHVLMGTDAPKEMGFEIKQGNNIYINLEPSSRNETKRIFDLLSVNGNVTMPLQDMFWGAYYGSFTDQFGINWMLNFQEK